ncbi:50S ribosomal protein L18 [Helicobacter marmotae]|uniref:Large ribosomal subunit protein uL18 n=1 Tax=Helicobacter marmotae TaxID=152490 RepID=A0A3D8I5R9_9HELI|nr:50S ribosomal protein L18 [Helicobacter marmotae]RDU60493.1 50S ribosomal protein L18 [Helicobacter marmotae]
MTEKVLKRKQLLRNKRKLRTRGKISRGRIHGVANKPRISVFKSNKYFYAQAINDELGVTLASIDGKKLGLGNNKEDAKKIAQEFAAVLKKANLVEVVFDRNGYLYHGVVAAFVDTLRENGIKL